jgi:hypothetical protein
MKLPRTGLLLDAPPPHIQPCRPARFSVKSEYGVHVDEFEISFRAPKPGRSRATVTYVYQQVARIELERLPQGREPWRPAKKECPIRMRRHGIYVALDDVRPREYVRVVSVLPTLAEWRQVVGDHVRPGEAEQIRPVTGSCAELNER